MNDIKGFFTVKSFADSGLSFTKTLADSTGLSGSKSIVVSYSNGVYEYIVKKFDNIEYQGTSSVKAVDVYNSIKTTKSAVINPFNDHDLTFEKTIASSKFGGKKINVSFSCAVFTYSVVRGNTNVYNGSSSMKAVDIFNALKN